MPAISGTLDRSNEPLNFRNDQIQKPWILLENENKRDFYGLIYVIWRTFSQLFFRDFLRFYENLWMNNTMISLLL